MTDEQNLDDLRERTEKGSRIEEAEDNQRQHELIEKFAEELKTMEQGDETKTVSVWDAQTAAVIRVLEDHDDLREEVATKLATELNIESPEATRSTILRMALRLGFREGSPELVEALERAREQRAKRTL